MFPNGRNANTNTHVDGVYSEARLNDFAELLEFQTASGRIAEITRNDFTAVIRKPVIDEDQVGVTLTDAIQAELPITAKAVVTDDPINMDKTLHGTYQLNPVNQAYIVPDVQKKMSAVIDKKIRYALDKYVIDTAIAQAGNTIAAVTDKATAEAAIDAVDELFTGYTNLEGEKKAIVAASKKKYFKHLASDRVSVMGDKVFLSGNLLMIDGIEFIFIQDAQLTDPSKILFVAGKPVGLWIDQAGFMNGERDAEVTDKTAYAVNLNKVHFSSFNVKAHVWSAQRNRLVVSQA